MEIIENCPYTDGPNGSGQYTYKIYHIGRHLPSWFRSIAPKTALEVHEESWNAYPYTKTKFSVPFVDKFSLEVETYFEPDGGSQVCVFGFYISYIILSITIARSGDRLSFSVHTVLLLWVYIVL